MGPCTASSCCCQACNLPWAPVPPPHAAARSRVCHGSLYGLPLLLSPSPHSAMCHFQVSSHCWWVPFCHRVLYGLPLLLSPSPHSAMCHFQVSSHCWCVFHFVIGCWQIMGLPLLLPGPYSAMGPCTAS
ncbi:unnamed protein product [Staurois parvus]|uniref:Uncharacterized protein n=1 Tax=Staurois parvus TaxID=386267 RepID=A0ABN9HAU8_9NEOB|nr:unnamed protein product [Staurois parvus]